VSYFGLHQHFDSHPNLAVTCSLCEIGFKNHQALILHTKSVHKDDKLKSPDETDDKSTTDDADIPGSPQEFPSDHQQQSFAFKSSTTSTNHEQHAQLVKQKPMTQVANNQDEKNNMAYVARSVRLNAQKATATILTTQTSSNTHHILANRVGFGDLSFVDFSCLNFPRIAQYYCELWPRKISTSTPLHKYTCTKCQYSFPCLESLYLHENCLITPPSSSSSSTAKPVQCQLFMLPFNSLTSYQCIRTTLDTIISQIEDEQANGDQTIETMETKDHFLKTFSLVKHSELDNYKRLNQMKMQMRANLLDVNPQYSNDMDKWRLLHTNLSNLQINLSKTYLKPSVNSNRPLLIRTKKLKRMKTMHSSTSSSSFVYSNMADISAVLNSNRIPDAKGVAKEQPVCKKTSALHGTFSMTSGNFSGSCSKIYNNKKNNGSVANGLGHSRADENAQSILSQNKRKQNNFGSNSDDTTDTLSNSKRARKSVLKRQSSNENSNSSPNHVSIVSDGESSTSANQTANFEVKIPNLYKAPLNIPLPNAQAGVDYKSKIKQQTAIQMPKLQPIPQAAASGTAKTHHQQVISMMPKLKRINAQSPYKLKDTKFKNKINMHSLINDKRFKDQMSSALVSPKPLPMIMNSKRLVSKSQTPNTQMNTLESPSFVKKDSTTVSTLANLKTSENKNVSLKCKFCSKIVKGQSEFLQHVLSIHPKMLKERLSRVKSVSTINIQDDKSIA
jgi:hypothetical protein